MASRALTPLSKVIVSFYMDNIDRDVVRCQRAVLERFIPSDFAIEQLLTSRSHAAAIDDFMREDRFYLPPCRACVMDAHASVDIDDEADLAQAERLLAARARARA